MAAVLMVSAALLELRAAAVAVGEVGTASSCPLRCRGDDTVERLGEAVLFTLGETLDGSGGLLTPSLATAFDS